MRSTHDPHANYCGNPIDSRPIGGVRAMGAVACVEECVETVAGDYLCPVCDDDQVDEMAPCDSCGLWSHTDKLRPAPGASRDDADRYCRSCLEANR